MEKVRAVWQWCQTEQRGWDLAALGGLGLMTSGIAWLSPAIALIVLGASVLLFSLWGAKLMASSRRREDD